ncbi:MAG: ribosome small subunit-dependent GTPase A [Chloroflexi bacterium HGW-Chloroflexi-10]|nr:MAG: ribosome small subunit-dependent GTPase A [Chloroflexi bacterium HGW-Chloroflexi-10]
MSKNLNNTEYQGTITFKTTGLYHVYLQGRELPCTLSRQLYPGNNGSKTPQRTGLDPVVGDRVQVSCNQAEQGVITAILPRENQLSRRAASPKPGGYAGEQVIAANVDQVVPVFAIAQPIPKWNLLDRYLALAESAGLPALICITKSDLIPQLDTQEREELQDAIETYRRIGYPVHLTSSENGEGLDNFRQALQGKISVFLGKSGVGKTSLLNAIQPGLGLRVGIVSAFTGKGKHTTTAMQLLPLDDTTHIIDTPGTREFGLWDLDPDELEAFFPEFAPFLGHCKFRAGCKHEEEPGCAVRKAVMEGHIHPRRYQSYIRLKEDGLQ